MMYSANYFGGKNYAVGYATSKMPLGPFTKSSSNPVLQKNIEQGGIVQAQVITALLIHLMAKKCFAYIMAELHLPAMNVWYLLTA